MRNDLIKTVLGDRKYFGICSLCGRRNPVGCMLDCSTCQACGEQHLGVVR